MSLSSALHFWGPSELNSKTQKAAPWPSLQDCILIYDEVLERPGLNPIAVKWVSNFDRRYKVTAGESLKDIDAFAGHIKKMMELAADIAPNKLTIVAAGGGSVSDFAGFLSAVFKRGVRLVLVPTTWLCAVDSAHGGKNGLNVAGVKNQIGVFRAADAIILSHDLLSTNSPAQIADATAEIVKIALISGEEFAISSSSDGLWSLLERAVQAKMKMVAADPYEKLGERRKLNLGHTLGHVLEATQGLSHGQAVGHGLCFAVEWSVSRKLMSSSAYKSMRPWLEALKAVLVPRPQGLSQGDVISALSHDKKRTGSSSIEFVFLKNPGSAAIEKVSINEILEEMRRTGWLR